jgi:hypothetical protein
VAPELANAPVELPQERALALMVPVLLLLA